MQINIPRLLIISLLGISVLVVAATFKTLLFPDYTLGLMLFWPVIFPSLTMVLLVLFLSAILGRKRPDKVAKDYSGFLYALLTVSIAVVAGVYLYYFVWR